MTKLISLFEAHHDRHELLHHRYDLFQLFMRTGGLFKADALSTLGLSQDGCVLRRGEQVYGLNCWEGTLPGEPDLIRSIESNLEYIDLGRSHTSILDVPKLISDKTRHLSLSEGLHDDYTQDININLRNISSLDLGDLCFPDKTNFFKRRNLSGLSCLNLLGTSIDTESLLSILSQSTDKLQLIIGDVVDLDVLFDPPPFEIKSLEIHQQCTHHIANRFLESPKIEGLCFFSQELSSNKFSADKFQGLKKLIVSGSIAEQGFIEQLIYSGTSLETFVLDWVKIGISDLRALFESKHIRCLSLQSVGIEDETLRGALSGSAFTDSKIEFLDLSSNDLTANSLKYLIDSGLDKNIIGLSMSMSDTGSNEIDALLLCGFPKLRYLSLPMYDAETIRLHESLRRRGIELDYFNGIDALMKNRVEEH